MLYANNNYITLPIIRGKTSIDFTRIDCHEVREYYRQNIFMRDLIIGYIKGNNFLGLQYIASPRAHNMRILVVSSNINWNVINVLYIRLTGGLLVKSVDWLADKTNTRDSSASNNPSNNTTAKHLMHSFILAL